jgi:hypothetical protein
VTLPAGTQLVFVYNADAGLASAALDWLHKIVSPRTYACSLCGVSYGHLGMRPEWREFIGTLDMPVRFAYRDRWATETAEAGDPPALWVVYAHGRREQRMRRADFDACASLDAMMAAVRAALV